MNSLARQVGDEAKGWLFPEEADLLYQLGLKAPGRFMVELGTYCAKSTCHLGAAAQERGAMLFTVDHHLGSPEMAPGEACHDPDMLIDDIHDTLPFARRTLRTAELLESVVVIAGPTQVVSSVWSAPIGLLFIDAGHDDESVLIDFEMWSPRIVRGGFLVFHDAPIPGIDRTIKKAEQTGFSHVQEARSMVALKR